MFYASNIGKHTSFPDIQMREPAADEVTSEFM